MAYNSRIIPQVEKEVPPFSLNSIKRVAFELSNLCNYAKQHKLCPLHKIESHKILSSKIVYKVASEFERVGFTGTFSFSRYNEPFMDPRFFLFVQHMKKTFPNSKVHATTNGYYMSQELAAKLDDYGIDYLTISLYSKIEEARLKALSYPIPVEFYEAYRLMDRRNDAYGRFEKKRETPCSRYAPLRELTINAYGDVSLCCMDWKNKYIFGNILQNSIEEIINTSLFIDTYNLVLSGNAPFALCHNCHAG